MANEFNITNKIQHISGTQAAQAANGAQNVQRQDGLDFINTLKSSIQDVNIQQQDSEKALADMADGSVKDLHKQRLPLTALKTA